MRLHLLILPVLLVACGAGPTGPQGPPGPSGTPHVFTGIAPASGIVAIDLPSAAGSDIAHPPAMACFYASPTTTGTWTVVGGDVTGVLPSCSATFFNSAWTARMQKVPSGWTAAFVVTY